MPDCDYCDRSFPDEDAYLTHLGEEHEDELGRIDSRRVAGHRSTAGISIPPMVYYAAGGLGLFLLSGALVYYAVGAFSGGNGGFVHEHGTIEVTVDGQSVNLHQYSDETEEFHFHPGDPQWHMESMEGRLTLADALSRIGIEVSQERLALPDRSYDESDAGTEVVVRVNGEQVDPASYELRDEDHAEIVVQTDG